MLSNLLKRNIYFTFTLVIFFGIALPTLLLSIQEFNHLRNDIVHENYEDVNNSTKLLTLGMSRALWEYSKEGMEPLGEAMLSNPNIVSVKIFDNSDRIYFYKEKADKKNAGSVKFLNYSILFNDRILGSVRVEYTNSYIEEKVHLMLIDFIKRRLINLTLTLIFLLSFLHFGYIKRINLLIEQARKLASRNLNFPFNWKADGDSLDQLGRDLEEARISLSALFNEVQKKNNELIQLNKNLSSLVEEKSSQVVHQARMAALGEMAAGIAHEINNPLTVVSGKAAQIERKIKNGDKDINPEEILDAMNKINKMSERIARIVKSLRYFSRNIESEEMSLVPLKKIFEDTLDLCLERMKFSGISFEIEPLPDLSLECRGIQISQVILNLINNAVDAIKFNDEKWIKIKFLVSSNEITIFVIDSGKGISKELESKIMQPFYTTKNADNGTGLGLSISSGLALEHQGRIYIDRNFENTCFAIKLPLRQV